MSSVGVLGGVAVNILIHIEVSGQVWQGRCPLASIRLCCMERLAGRGADFTVSREACGIHAGMAGRPHVRRFPPCRVGYKLPGFGALPSYAAPRYGMGGWALALAGCERRDLSRRAAVLLIFGELGDQKDTKAYSRYSLRP